MEELFQILGQHIEKAAAEGINVNTCVLSGGGSQLAGAVELAEEVLGMPVRLGKPRELLDTRNMVDSPIYATAVGMLQFAAGRLPARRKVKEPRSLTASTVQTIIQWIKRLRR